jgi:hypothetical protein
MAGEVIDRADPHPSDRPGPGLLRPRGAAIVATALIVVVTAVTVTVLVVVGGSPSRPPAPSGGSFPATGGPPPGRRAATGTGAGAGPGVSVIAASGSFLIIPSLGVRAPLVRTGATGAPQTASLTVPDDVHTVAWWDGTVRDGARTIEEDAPEPGQPGVALIAGHIDSATAGPGALYDLRDITVGATVEIVDSHGHVSFWAVTAPPETKLKTELPPALWVTTGPPTLALVTCGGPFDAATGHYLDNVIVWARPRP